MTDTDIRVAATVAVARNGVIGKDGSLPWRMAADMKWFKTVTMGKPIIMGRTTFEDLASPLPGRHNIVVSRTLTEIPKGVTLARHGVEAIGGAIEVARQDGTDEVHVIGGAAIYQTLGPRIDRYYVTHIAADVEGDRTIALPDRDDWAISSLRTIEPDEKNDYPAVVEQWDRQR